MTLSSATPSLKADCSACMGICCVAPSFEKGEEFGRTKPALTPCNHLNGNNRCKIYNELEWNGFKACGGFDCKGAGQYLTQVMYAGKSWRDGPDVLAEMAESYRRLRRIHDMLEIFTLAEQLPLNDSQEVARIKALRSLAPRDGWDAQALENAEAAGFFAELQGTLTSFRTAFSRG